MGWLPGYGYRKPLVITGGASGAQTDFQLDIDIAHVAAKMQANFDDIRFTQNNGTTLIDAWLESKVDSASAKTVVEFLTTPANTVESDPWYVYYGKADAMNYWDGGATFPFFDDFDNDMSKWTGDTGSASLSSSIMTLTGAAAAWKTIRGNVERTIPVAMRTKAQFVGVDAVKGGEIGFRDGATNDWAEILYYDVLNRFRVRKAGSETSVVTNADTAMNIYEIEAIPTSVKLSKNDVEMTGSPVTTNIPIVDMPVIFAAIGGAGYEVKSDWVLFRKYAANPPTYAFGAEQSAPTGAAPMGVFTGCFGRPFGGII